MLLRQRKQVARMIKTAHTANMAQADLTANRDVVECLFRVSLLDGIDDYTDTLDVLSQGTELDALERL